MYLYIYLICGTLVTLSILPVIEEFCEDAQVGATKTAVIMTWSIIAWPYFACAKTINIYRRIRQALKGHQ